MNGALLGVGLEVEVGGALSLCFHTLRMRNHVENSDHVVSNSKMSSFFLPVKDREDKRKRKPTLKGKQGKVSQERNK